MKDIYMVGAGAFAAELTEYIEGNLSHTNAENQINILGYFDINVSKYNYYGYEAPYLGSEKDYSFLKKDSVIIGIANQNKRSEAISFFKSINVSIEGFVHHTSIISRSSKLGYGNIICPYVIIGPRVELGNDNIVNYNCSIAHDCLIGDSNILSPSVKITGNVKIGNSNLFGVSSGVTPSIRIGSLNKIQAGLVVDKDISDKSIYFKKEHNQTMRIYK